MLDSTRVTREMVAAYRQAKKDTGSTAQAAIAIKKTFGLSFDEAGDACWLIEVGRIPNFARAAADQDGWTASDGRDLAAWERGHRASMGIEDE